MTETLTPTEPADDARTPLYWLRQKRGDLETERLTEFEAAAIAQRPDALGSHLRPSGVVWRRRNPEVSGGWDYFTVTPVYEEPRNA